jgi:hypothetical protein
MPNRMQILAGAVTILATREVLYTRPLRRKYEALSYAHAGMYVENIKLKTKVKYLLHVLEENGVQLSDFDLIALTHDIEKS